MTMTMDIFRSLPVADLRLYYQHTCIRCRMASNQPFRWIFVNEITSNHPDGTRDKCILFLDENKLVHSLPIAEMEVDFIAPASGVYGFKNTVVVLEKNPVRQTSKGLAKSNTHITNLLAAVRHAGGIPPSFYDAHDFPYTAAGLNLLLEDAEPLEWEKGLLKILKKQALAIAVNARIAVSQGIISQFPTIWLKRRMIGELNPRQAEIYPLHDAFVSELSDTFLDKGFSIKTE